MTATLCEIIMVHAACGLPNSSALARKTFTKAARSRELDDALQSVIHVPGVCDGVTDASAGYQDSIVVSEKVLVGLLMDAIVGATWPGWREEGLEDSQKVALQRAVKALRHVFEDVAQKIRSSPD